MADIIEIEGPDGSVIEFPTGTDDATIQQVMQQTFSQVPQQSFGSQMLDAVGDAANSAIEYVSDAWTGEGRKSPDISELPKDVQSTFKEGEGVLGAKLSLSRGDLGKSDIYRRFFANDPMEIDENGNVIVNRDGKKYYLNEPGFSGQDISDIGTAALIELPFATAGGRIAGGAGALGRAVGVGLAAGAGSVVQDIAAGQAGSEQGIDPTNAAIATLGGGVFEFASPMLKPFFRKFFRSPKMARNGTLTSAGRKTLSRLGIDPDDITPEFSRQFEQMARDAVTPDDLTSAARRAQAREFDILLSQGDATGRVRQQGFEDMALKGGYGPGAEDSLRGFRERQTDSVMGARAGFQNEIGGQNIAPYEGLQATQNALRESMDTAKAGIRDAYQEAAGRKAGVLKSGIKGMAQQVRRNFTEFNPATAPKAASLVKQLEGFEKRFPGNIKSVSMKAIEAYRQQVSRLSQSADPIERAAAGNIRKSLDGYLDSAVDDALLTGDTTAIDAFKNARSLRAEFSKKFQGDKILEKLVDQQDGTFLMEPSEATRFLFGSSQLGGKTGATKALRRIKAIVGEDSPAWQGLREEAFLKLFPDDKAMVAKFPRAFDKAMRDSPELLAELFNLKERRKLQRFAGIIGNVTQRAPGAVNHSATASTLSRLAQDVFGNSRAVGSFVANLPFVKDITGAARNAANASKARAATSPHMPARQIVPPGIAGTVGSVGMQQHMDPEQNKRLDLARALMSTAPSPNKPSLGVRQANEQARAMSGRLDPNRPNQKSLMIGGR